MTMSIATAPLSSEACHQIDQVIEKYRGLPGDLLLTLEEIQEAAAHKYLTGEILLYVAQEMNIPLSRIYSVVTFYAFFNLEPQGDHTICICRGTACHTRGSRNLLAQAKLYMGQHGAPEDKGDQHSLTTADRKFTVRTVACFGQCALAPVVEIDRNIYGRMNERELRKAIDEISQEATQA